MGAADMQWIMSFAGKYPALDIVAIFFAQYLAYIVVLIFAIALLLQKDIRRRMYIIFVSALSFLFASGVIKMTLNYFFYRPRPFVAYNITPLISHAADASFPSGHATFFFTLATLVFLCMSRRWGIWAFIIAALIGAARVYAGLHYPLDILGGAGIGMIAPFIIRSFLPPRITAVMEPIKEQEAAA